MLFKRIAAMLALAFGFLGVVACLVGMYGVWSLGSRLDQANEKVFARVDKGLSSAQDRVRGVQKRVDESRITTDEIGRTLREWSSDKAKERLAAQLQLESRAEKLTGCLQTAGLWLETSIDSIQAIQQVLELGISLGVRVDPGGLEDVLEKLAAVRSKLQQTEQSVDGIRTFAAGKEDGVEENRRVRLTQLLGRMLLTISEINTRLEEAVSGLAEFQTGTQQLRVKTSRYIWFTTIGCELFLAWIAAGQAALCLWGWKNCCRSRASA